MQSFYQGDDIRPIIHFTPQQGFMNDPNGLCKYGDTYFLFFQHNPAGLTPGNTHWGMAVSKDLLHWTQCEPAICPDEIDGSIFSGSGIVDYDNRSGLKSGFDDPILLYYTGTGFRNRPAMQIGPDGKPQFPADWVQPPTRQCIAYSLDGGKTFTKYVNNPILPQYEPLNRDPKVNYVPEENAFVMVLFLKDCRFKLFWSENLLTWQEGQELELLDTAECPDIFQLDVDGDPNQRKWVFFASPENYILGHFQNRVFVAETDLIVGAMAKSFHNRKTFTDCPAYAPQTYYAPEENRIIQLSWIPTRFPGMQFQGQMSLPWELELVTTPEGIRLKKQFAREVKQLRKGEKHCTGSDCKTLNNVLIQKASHLFQRKITEARELCLNISLEENGRFSFAIRGVPISYDHAHQRLFFPTGEYILPICGNDLDMRIIVDRGSAELFACRGLFNCVLNAPLDVNRTEVEFYALEGATIIADLYELSL